MADSNRGAQKSYDNLGLTAPAAVGLRRGPPSQLFSRVLMERTISEDIREEREDLKEAAEYTQSVVVDLTLDGIIRFVSPSWLEIVGTTPDTVIGKPIANLLVSDKRIFANATEALQKDDSRSQNVRFSVIMGPT